MSTLPELSQIRTEKINAEHRAAQRDAASAIAHAREAGRLLTAAKAACGHGQWLPWLDANFEGSHRTAQSYMQAHARRDQIDAKAHGCAHLTIDRARQLAADPWIEVPPGYFPNDRIRASEALKIVEAAVDARALTWIDRKSQSWVMTHNADAIHPAAKWLCEELDHQCREGSRFIEYVGASLSVLVKSRCNELPTIINRGLRR